MRKHPILGWIAAIIVIGAIVAGATKGGQSGGNPKQAASVRECDQQGAVFQSPEACGREATHLAHAAKPSAMYAGDYLACEESVGSSFACGVAMKEVCETAGLSEEVCYHGEQQAEASEEAVQHAEHGELDGATPQERALEAVEE